ncbi:hypothetical protein U8V72_20985 [Priestia filamentosa]|uniref:hypothetical protein n=1 Tax=Priestia filamentosa TaxID=1402861 RepID=UPI00397D0306
MEDMKRYLIVALGYNRYLHREIDKIYEKDKWTYYEVFKESGFYNDIVIKSFTVTREEKMRKIAGVVEWCYKNNDLSLIEHLIKKGYKDVLRYYQQNKEQLNLEEFSSYIIKKKGKHTEVAEIELAMYYSVLSYMTFEDEKDVNSLFSTSFGNLAFELMNNLIVNIEDKNDYITSLKRNRVKQEEKEKVIEFINQTLRMDINKKIPTKVNELLDSTLNQGIEEKAKTMALMVNRNKTIEFVENIRSNVYKEDVFKYIDGYSFIFSFSELNYDDILDIEITKEELILYASNSLSRKKGNNYTNNEIKQHFISSLFMHSLFEQYKRQKETLIDDTTETWYLDMKNKEHLFRQQEKAYEETKSNLKRELEEIKEKRQNELEEREQLKKEIERLKQEVAISKEDKEELVELRNFVYNQQKINFAPNELAIGEMMKVLNGKKIIVCGGHPNMQRKLKEWMPNLDILSTETIGKDFSYLRGYDVVYFYPNYASHSFYKKIRLSIYDSNTKFVYLPDVDNIEQLIMTMYEHITIETRV